MKKELREKPYSLDNLKPDKKHGITRRLPKRAGLIKENIRQTDLAARYSNDLFALILINSGHHTFPSVVERIREKVARQYNGDITISTGLAVFPEDSARSLSENIVEAPSWRLFKRLEAASTLSYGFAIRQAPSMEGKLDKKVFEHLVEIV